MQKIRFLIVMLLLAFSGSSLLAQANIESFTLYDKNANSYEGKIIGSDIVIVVEDSPARSFTTDIKISDGATVIPASGVMQDFNSFVIYTVKGIDGSQKTYKVTVEEEITSRAGSSLELRYQYLLIKKGELIPDPGYKMIATNMKEAKPQDFVLDIELFKDKSVLDLGAGNPTRVVDDLLSVGANPYGLDICYKETNLNRRVINQSVLVPEAEFVKIKDLSNDLKDGVDYVVSSELICCIDYDGDGPDATYAFLPDNSKQTIINAISVLKKGGQARFYWVYHIGGTTTCHVSLQGEPDEQPYAVELEYYANYKKIIEEIAVVKPNIKYLLMHDTDLFFGLLLIIMNE